MDVPRLFKTATPEFVARKVFKIKSLKRNDEPEAIELETAARKVKKKIEKAEVEKNEEEEGEARHMAESSNDITSSTDTGTPKQDPKVPVLAVGTYHRKEAAPILAAAARLDLTLSKPSSSKDKGEPIQQLPHPSECGQPCVSPQSQQMFQNRITNAQGPPPTWQPPRPPGQMRSDHDYTNDYEDPEELARHRDPLLIQTTLPQLQSSINVNNSYEMSMSQQRRSQPPPSHQMMTAPPLVDWNETGGVLHKNAEGAYYIPSGSLRTASSKLSPASSGQRYLDQPHTSTATTPAPNSAYSDASTTLLKYPLTGTQPNRRRQISTMNAIDAPSMSITKKKKMDKDDGFWRRATPSKCTILLIAALLSAICVIAYLLLKSPSYVYTEPSPSADASSTASRYSELGLQALPPVISLGERVDVEFYPRYMATTEITLARAQRVVFNATVGSGAQLVLLIRAGVPPSFSLHDALFPIRADRIRDSKAASHIVEEISQSKMRRRSINEASRRGSGTSSSSSSIEILSPRSTSFEQFLLEGRHYLTFINERNRVEPISFIVDELKRRVDKPSSSSSKFGDHQHPLAASLVCEANCNQRGECVNGKCQCVGGFTGVACEESICPVVCSGNGVFSGGVCVCKAGFKGKECEMRTNWCEVADCNGRGRCDTDGKCRCNSGWTGDGCETKACQHPTCHDRGVCVNGTCYCVDGWRGADCSVFADSLIYATAKPTTTTTTSAKTSKSINNKSKSKKIDKRPMVNRDIQQSDECNAHGKLNSDEICECDDGFNGLNCQQKSCANCTNGDCQPDGSCACWKGWRGTGCQSKQCAVGCEDHGKCLNSGKCQCEHGYNGDNCFIEGCPNDCSKRGECVLDARLEEWSCRCQIGAIGTDCSVLVEQHCDDGLDNDNDGLVDCDDPECCTQSTCSSESVCSTTMSPLDVLIRMPPVTNANFGQRVSFLIKDKSVQSYADVSQFNETLIAVVRGRVVWNGGGGLTSSSSSEELTIIENDETPMVPLTGVRVSDTSHPLYGFTLSRADGYFDLVVNGGRSINMQFLRTQFQTVKKSVYISPGQIVHIDDVILQRSSIHHHQQQQQLQQQQQHHQSMTSSLLARAKCSPALRHLPQLSLISNWHYTTDGIDDEATSARLVVDSRSIIDSVRILGTDLKVVYDSARSPKAPSTMLIGLLDENVDGELRKVHVDVRIAGRRFDFTLAPRVNLTHVFTWDKLNAYRQLENGLIPVTVRVGYEFVNCDRRSEIVWQTRQTRMLGAVSRKMIGNMWTIDIHHHLDVVNNIVELGNGGYRLIGEYEPKVTVVAGVEGPRRDIDCGKVEECEGMLNPIRLFRPTAMVYAIDGSLIIGDHNLIRRINVDGNVNTILILNLADTSHSYYLAVSPFDGTIVISLPLHKQVWKITSLNPDDPRNNYEIIAGDGSVCGSAVDACGDSGLAQNAQLIFPKGMAFDRNGNLYLADSRRIRVIDTNGHIRSIGEVTPESNPIRSCNPISKLVDLQMEWPTALSIDLTTGLIYVLDTNVVYEIDTQQNLVTIALGAPSTCEKTSSVIINGTSAISASSTHLIQHARDITITADGSILVVESDGKRLNQVRKLSSDRATFSTLIGSKSPCSCDIPACGCDDEHREVDANSAHLNSPHAVITSPNGEVLVSDSANGKIKKISQRMASYEHKTRTYEVLDPEKMEKFTFNRHGQHTSTISMINTKPIYTFTYNVDSVNAVLTNIKGASGLLVHMTHHNETNIDMETTTGEITSFTMTTYDNTLETISRRSHGSQSLISQRDVTKLAYTTPGELLSSRMETAGEVVGYEYDSNGRANGLKRDGEYWRLGNEVISMGRAINDVFLNGRRIFQMRIGDGDVAIEPVSDEKAPAPATTTRLITMQRDGYSLTTSFGTTSLFDKTPSFGEPAVVSRRRTTVPAISDPQRRALTTRWDWRFVMKRSGEPKRVAEINGVNMFSIEYNVEKNRDTLRLGSGTLDDSSLLNVDYTEAGMIRRISSAKDDEKPLKMSVDYDSMGRRTDIKWGKWHQSFKYDSSNRLIESIENGARIPIKMNYSDWSRHPKVIEYDSRSQWRLEYDNYDRLKQATSPSGEWTRFSSIALGGDEWILKRTSRQYTDPYQIRVDRRGRIVESITPDGTHHWLINCDENGRTTHETNDGDVTRVTRWAPDGEILATKSRALDENTVLQGHLIARKEIVMKLEKATSLMTSFTYEYDDLFRPISIQPMIEQSVLETIQIQYDERTGHITSISGFSMIRDSTTTRCHGHGLTYEIVRDVDHQQIVERKIIFGDTRAQLKIERDGRGRAISSQFQTTSNGNQKAMNRVARSFDSMGRVASWEEDGEKTRISYDQDGRVEKINDRLIEYHIGGSIKTHPDANYDVESIGWVTKRNNITFGYDGKGRLVTAQIDGKTKITLKYDRFDRLVSIKNNEDVVTIYYAMKTRQVSHWVKNGIINTIVYDDDDSAFAIISSDGSRWAVMCDETKTLRTIIGDSKSIKTIRRNVFGAVISDDAPNVWTPLGYLGGIDIDGINVTIMASNGRPLDLMTSRYLSVSPEAVKRVELSDDEFYEFGNSMDLLAIEVKNQPFALSRIPTTFEEWFKLSGLSDDLLPSKRLGLPTASIDAAITHRLISSFPRKLEPLTELSTIGKSRLQPTLSKHLAWSVEDIGFSNLMILAENTIDDVVDVTTLPTLNEEEARIIENLFRGAKVLDIGRWTPAPSPVRHYWKGAAAAAAASTTTTAAIAEEMVSSMSLPHFLLSANQDHVEIRNGKMRILIHFEKEKNETIQKIVKEMKERETIAVWKAEKRRLLNGDATNYSDGEKRELLSKPGIRGYRLELKTSHKNAHFATPHSWKIRRDSSSL